MGESGTIAAVDVSYMVCDFAGTMLFKAECPNCKTSYFGGTVPLKCDKCGVEFLAQKEGYEVRATAKRGQNGWRKAIRDAGLHRIQHCYWCGRTTGTYVLRNGKLLRLEKHYDHKLPFSLKQGHDPANLCVSCHLCNLWKSSNVFDTEEECQNYLLSHWEHEIASGQIEE